MRKPTQHGAWTGIGVGGLLGILFPPSLLGSAIVGGTAGAVIGHLWHGMSRGDMKDLGETLDEGQAARSSSSGSPSSRRRWTAS